MSDNIAMGRPGTQFSGDGISLSWPRQRNGEPGVREVIELPNGRRPERIRRMILEGAIVEVDEAANAEGEYRNTFGGRELFAGGSRQALERMAEPAGPVIRQVFVPVGELALQEEQATVLVDDPDEDRRPATAEPEPEPEPEAPAPSFEERVDALADNYAIGTLQKKARALGVTASDLPEGAWTDKVAVSREILTRQDLEAPSEE